MIDASLYDSDVDAALNTEIKRLVDTIVAEIHPLRIILFGSAARGEATPQSDIDLLVVVPNGTHRLHTMQQLYAGIHGVGVPYDILVATPLDLERHAQTPGLIYRDVLREGRELYAA